MRNIFDTTIQFALELKADMKMPKQMQALPMTFHLHEAIRGDFVCSYEQCVLFDRHCQFLASMTLTKDSVRRIRLSTW